MSKPDNVRSFNVSRPPYDRQINRDRERLDGGNQAIKQGGFRSLGRFEAPRGGDRESAQNPSSPLRYGGESRVRYERGDRQIEAGREGEYGGGNYPSGDVSYESQIRGGQGYGTREYASARGVREAGLRQGEFYRSQNQSFLPQRNEIMRDEARSEGGRKREGIYEQGEFYGSQPLGGVNERNRTEYWHGGVGDGGQMVRGEEGRYWNQGGDRLRRQGALPQAMAGEKRHREEGDYGPESARSIQPKSQYNKDNKGRERGDEYGKRQEEHGPERGGGNNRSAHQYCASSKSALSTGVCNPPKSYTPKWAFISKAINLTKDPNIISKYIGNNINEIIALEAIDLHHAVHLSSILNKADKVPNALKTIIDGWENKGQLNAIFKNVTLKVGNSYPANRNNKKGSQEIALIFNALSKLDDCGSMVNKFYDEVENSRKWEEILRDANAQDISNIFNALAKINDGGTKVQQFYAKIDGQRGLDKIIQDANAQSISNIFNALSKIPGQGDEVAQFFSKIDSRKWQEILQDANAQDISNIFKALAKTNDGGTNISEFYEKISTSGMLPNILDASYGSDFANISTTICALNNVKDGDGELVKKFYNNSKKNYTKTGEKLQADYPKYIKNPKAILLDLHGFSHEAAEIVTKLFLDEVGDKGNPFYIECGRGTHSSSEKEEEMPNRVNKVLNEKNFHTIRVEYRCFEIEKKLPRAPSASTNLGSGEALDTHSQGVGTKG